MGLDPRLESLAAAVVVHRGECVLAANAAFADLVGGDAADGDRASGGLLAWVAPGDRARLGAYYRRLFTGQAEPDRHEIRLTTAAGAEVWAEAVDQVIDWQGAPAVQTLLVEVSGRVRAREALAQSEQRYRDLVENSVQGLIVHRDNKPLYVNKTFAEMCGWDGPEEVMRFESVDQYIAPEERDRLREYRERRVRGEPAPPGYVFRGLRKDGSRFWMETRHARILWDGEPAVQSVAFDVTKRVEAEAALRKSRQRFRDFAESASDWFWETDAEHRFTGFRGGRSEKAIGLVGAGVGDSALDMRIADDDDENWHQHRADVEARRPIRQYRFAARDLEGSLRHLRISARPLMADDGRFLGYRGTATDITVEVESRRHADRAQQRLIDALESMPAALALFDADEKLVMCNAQYREFFPSMRDLLVPGTSVETFIRHWVANDFLADAVEDREQFIQDRLAQFRNPVGAQVQHLADGRWFQLVDKKLDDGGTIRIRIEVTELKRVEAEVTALNQELESRVAARTRDLAGKSDLLEATFESISEGFALFDSDDRLVFCNERYREFARPIGHLIKPGVPYETLLRATVESGVIEHPGDGAEAKIQGRLARHRHPRGNFEVKLGDGRWLIIAERRTRDGGTALVQTDITDVKRAEQEARSILDASPFAVGVTRLKDGKFLYVNSPHAALYRLDAAGLEGRRATQFWADLEDRERFLETFRRDGRVPATEVRMKRLDGSIFWAILAWERMPLFGDDTVLFWVHDISDLVAAREAVLGAKEEAESANRAKSEFLSRMSHELRTPLNAVLGFAQMIRDFSESPLSGEQAEYVRQIIAGAKHLGELIDDVLDLSKIEAGRIAMSPAPIAARPVIEECLALAANLASDRGITISADLDGADAGQVMADATRLKQVIINLLSNAVKYNRDGGSVTVETLVTDDGMLRVTVGDTGIGIPADKREQVFLPFSRLGAERTKITGTGIGLTISRQLIELMGGRMDFDSVVGEGSRFWLEIPLAEQTAADGAPAQ